MKEDKVRTQKSLILSPLSNYYANHYPKEKFWNDELQKFSHQPESVSRSFNYFATLSHHHTDPDN